ncbi:GNAT family protein [soil metagenome]
MNNPYLIGDRIYLRAVEPTDAAVLAACNNDPNVRHTFFTHTPTSVTQQTERAKTFYAAGSDYIPFIICLRESDIAVGVTALVRVDLVSHAAVYMVCLSDSTQWGQGFAGDVTRLMLEYGFNVLNLHRVQLHVWADNPAAVRTYEKCGFVREGILREAMRHGGRYCDFLVMGILEQEYRKQPREKEKEKEEEKKENGKARAAAVAVQPV